ncbi:hypothetical protein OQA88_2463 [Cercophora sp. LCS_1]
MLSKLPVLVLAGWATSVLGVEASHIPFNITALSSRDGYSLLECWQLASIPVDAMQAMNYAIGETTAATWSRIEPRTTVGEAWAPKVQLSMILNGLIRITSPTPLTRKDSSSNGSVPLPDPLAVEAEAEGRKRPESRVAYIMPGTLKSSVLIAADIKAASTIAGHFTEFPSDEPTVLVQIPFEGNKAPEHTVLYEGACI